MRNNQKIRSEQEPEEREINLLEDMIDAPVNRHRRHIMDPHFMDTRPQIGVMREPIDDKKGEKRIDYESRQTVREEEKQASSLKRFMATGGPVTRSRSVGISGLLERETNISIQFQRQGDPLNTFRIYNMNNLDTVVYEFAHNVLRRPLQLGGVRFCDHNWFEHILNTTFHTRSIFDDEISHFTGNPGFIEPEEFISLAGTELSEAVGNSSLNRFNRCFKTLLQKIYQIDGGRIPFRDDNDIGLNLRDFNVLRSSVWVPLLDDGYRTLNWDEKLQANLINFQNFALENTPRDSILLWKIDFVCKFINNEFEEYRRMSTILNMTETELVTENIGIDLGQWCSFGLVTRELQDNYNVQTVGEEFSSRVLETIKFVGKKVMSYYSLEGEVRVDIVETDFKFRFVVRDGSIQYIPNNFRDQVSALGSRIWFDKVLLPPIYRSYILTIEKIGLNPSLKKQKLIYDWVETNCWNRFLFLLGYVINSGSVLGVIHYLDKNRIVRWDNANIETLVLTLDELLEHIYIDYGLLLVDSTWKTIQKWNTDSKILFVLFGNVGGLPHIELMFGVDYHKFETKLFKSKSIQDIKPMEKNAMVANYRMAIPKCKPKEYIEIFVDIETQLSGNRDCYMIATWIPTEASSYVYRSIKEFMGFLENHRWQLPRINIWAHNGAKFDYIYFLPYLKDVYICGTIHNLKMMRFKLGGYEFVTYDMFLTFPASLKSLGLLFETQTQKGKQDMMLGVNDLEDVEEHFEELADYCIDDCKVLEEVHTKFKKALVSFGIKIPDLWISVADLATQIFRLNFLERPIYGVLFELYEILRKSYFGGYTMVFKHKMEKGYAWDINSSYPYIMTQSLPVIDDHNRYPKWEQAFSWTNIPHWGNTKKLVHVVKYRFAECNYIVPFAIKTGEGNLYKRNGKDIWVWDHVLEFVYMSGYYHDFDIEIDGYYAFGSRNVYQKYVETFYSKRVEYKKNNNKIMDSLCKLLLNSLYGKTGQKEFTKTEILDCETMFERIVNPQVSVGSISKLDETHVLFEHKNESIHPNHIGALIYIASYITSQARVNLWDAILQIRKEGGNVYYCDTDSIYTDSLLPSGLISDTRLGGWKLEYMVNKGKFWGSKSYIIEKVYEQEDNLLSKGLQFQRESIVKFKGVPQKYLPTSEELWAWDEDKVEEFVVKIDTTWNRKFGYVENKPMDKKMRMTLNKRIYKNNDSICLE